MKTGQRRLPQQAAKLMAIVLFQLTYSLFPNPNPAQATSPVPSAAIPTATNALVTTDALGTLALRTQVGTASDGPATEIQWTRAGEKGTNLTLSLSQANPSAPSQSLTEVELGGYRLPARLVLLSAKAEVNFEQTLATANFSSEPDDGAAPALAKRHIPIELAADGTQTPYPDLVPTHTAQLPSRPVSLLRQGWLRGQRVAILALTPIFEQGGVRQRVTKLNLLLPGTQPMQATDLQAWASRPLAELPNLAQPQMFSSPSTTQAETRLRVTVAQAGMQRVTGQMLAEAGVAIGALDPQQVQVWWRGQELAVDWPNHRSDVSGQVISADDELRFYVGQVGDRWNAAETLWLTVSDKPVGPKRMSLQLRAISTETAPAATNVRQTAFERGIWRQSTTYRSVVGGPDGDHWFAKQLTQSDNQAEITLTSQLPLVSGPMSMTLLGSTYVMTTHHLTVRAEGPVLANQLGTANDGVEIQLVGAGDWQQTFSLPSNASAASIQLSSDEALARQSFLLDGVAWERPVALDFGGRGGHFVGASGQWIYQLSNVPSQATIYDVSQPAAPSIVDVASANTAPNTPSTRMIASDSAQDATPDATQGEYWVSGEGALFTATLQPAPLRIVAVPSDTRQIYIVPETLLASLQPLLAWRATQGVPVAAVSVQDIYDGWSGGQVSPEAIRQFLQAMAQLTPHLQSVALVGDGTYDPLDYSGKHLPTLIPPFLAHVDPDVGETACESCYGQLDGADALSDPIPDLAIGRLPVKSVAELDGLVQKIIAYERAPVDAWQWRSGHVADNHRESNSIPDEAGNFPAYADTAADLQPGSVDRRKVYFDPYSATNLNKPWREPDPLVAHSRVVSLFNDGAAVVNYQGHGQIDRWAYTAETPSNPVNYLFGAQDVAQLRNGVRLPVVLEMACLTGAFMRPEMNGSTIDELLLLAPQGGAIATWGSTGLGVAYQHEFLQAGFYSALWAKPGEATLGELTQAGLLNLFNGAGCCLDAMQTYALQGDPMTRVRVMLPQRIFLPNASKIEN